MWGKLFLSTCLQFRPEDCYVSSVRLCGLETVTDKKQFTFIFWHLGIILWKVYAAGNHKALCGPGFLEDGVYVCNLLMHLLQG